mgnify:CR=1 FL=1
MSEADVRLRFIDPALKSAGWNLGQIKTEYSFTEGNLYF